MPKRGTNTYLPLLKSWLINKNKKIKLAKTASHRNARLDKLVRIYGLGQVYTMDRFFRFTATTGPPFRGLAAKFGRRRACGTAVSRIARDEERAVTSGHFHSRSKLFGLFLPSATRLARRRPTYDNRKSRAPAGSF